MFTGHGIPARLLMLRIPAGSASFVGHAWCAHQESFLLVALLHATLVRSQNFPNLGAAHCVECSDGRGIVEQSGDVKHAQGHGLVLVELVTKYNAFNDRPQIAQFMQIVRQDCSIMAFCSACNDGQRFNTGVQIALVSIACLAS